MKAFIQLINEVSVNTMTPSISRPNLNNISMHSELTQINETQSDMKSALHITSDSLIKEINEAKAEDLKAIHTQGHWVRDMRAVSYLYQWIDRAAAWLPASALGVAAFVVGLTTIATTATIATLGAAAIVIPLVGVLVTAQAWAERESNKNQNEKRLTNEFRGQRSALLTGKPAKSGQGKVNEFSRYTPAMNHYIFDAIQQNSNATLYSLNQEKIKQYEMNLAFELLLGGKKRAALTPLQAKNFRERIPAFIIALRQLLENNDSQALINDQHHKINLTHVRKNLIAQGFTPISPFRASDNISSLKCLHILEPIELSEAEFQKLKNGGTLYSQQLDSLEIDQVVSVKKIQRKDEHQNNTILYRLYATVKIDLYNKEKNNEPIELNSDQQALFENQIKRAMLARAETTWAGHGVDNLVGIFRALSNPQSKLYLSGLTQDIVKDNDYLKTWGADFESITTPNQQTKAIDGIDGIDGIDIKSSNLYLLDQMTQMSQDEYDFLFLERTGSRSPFSTGGQQPHFINKAQHIQTGLKKRQRAIMEHFDTQKELHADGINLPFLDKLRFSSTHCAPFHSHEYFLKLHELHMVDYRGVNTEDESIATPLSRRAMINIYEDKQFQNKQYYSEHGFARTTFTKRQPGFGPVENNNSKSIISSIKRFNSSRDLLITLASLHKKDVSGGRFEKFKFNDNTERCGQVSWNSDPIIGEMNHAMNITMLHNEIRKLEAAIHDLQCILSEYQQLKGSRSISQEMNHHGNPTETSPHSIAYLDTVIFQKKIKVLTSEVADQINNLFKTQIDYQIAYSHDKHNNESIFTKEQHKEINAVFSSLRELTQSSSLKVLFERVHTTIAHNRNRFGGGGILNGFRGRSRFPFARQFTFRGSMERLLTKNVKHGLDTLKQALIDVTNQRFKMESILAEQSETLQNMKYIESLAL